MRCIIVDDEEMSRTALTHLVEQVDYLHLTGQCSNAMDASNFLEKERIDLMFLDVEMPEMTGLEFLRNLSHPPLVILTTSHTKYALDAFEHNVVDYLVKPIQLARFMKATNKAREIFESNAAEVTSDKKDYFFVRTGGVLNKIKINDILYIEALGDYITIFTVDKKYVLHMTLKAIEGKLPPRKFVRVHRSFMVAVDNVSSVEDTTIYIREKPIPVGALYRENFMKRLNMLT